MISTTSRNERKSEILKVDARGSGQVTAERREALLHEFDRSGMSGAGFAKYNGIKYTTFAYWIQAQRRKQKPSKRVGESQFLMVAVDETNRVNGLTVELSHGVTLKITTARSRGYATLFDIMGCGRRTLSRIVADP